MDLKNTLSEDQQLPTIADFTKMKNTSYWEDIGPPTHILKLYTCHSFDCDWHDKPRWTSPNLRRRRDFLHHCKDGQEGCNHLDCMKYDLQGLEGQGNISWGGGDEENYLPVFQDAGGVSQHRRVGCRSMVDSSPVVSRWRQKKNDDVVIICTHCLTVRWWSTKPGWFVEVTFTDNCACCGILDMITSFLFPQHGLCSTKLPLCNHFTELLCNRSTRFLSFVLCLHFVLYINLRFLLLLVFTQWQKKYI